MHTYHPGLAKATAPTSSSLASSTSRLLQRKCACRSMSGPTEECQDCRRQRLQRSASNSKPRPVSTHWVLSKPADPMELEADRVADSIINGKAVPGVVTQGQTNALPRQAELDELDDSAGDETFDETSDLVEESQGEDEDQPSGDESGRPKLSSDASVEPGPYQIAIPNGVGAALQGNARTFMESRFGHDFSRVRVHTDESAARSAQKLQAHAYTVGQNIYFNEGRYRPESTDGRRLLAHELTHVLQQTGGSAPVVQRAPTQKPKRSKRRAKAPRATAQQSKGKPKAKLPCAQGKCDGNCAKAVETAVRHPFCGNEVCSNGAAASSSNFIRHLDVDLTTQMVTAEIGTATKTLSKDVFLSSPNPGTTPMGRHTIGVKCGPCHTNRKAHGMGWFAGFHNNLEFGFHNSQKVQSGTHSAGCVRVAPCAKAKWVHDNTASGVTTVCVHKGDHCQKKSKDKKKTPNRGSGPSSPLPTSPEPAPLVSEAEGGETGNRAEGDEESV